MLRPICIFAALCLTFAAAFIGEASAGAGQADAEKQLADLQTLSGSLYKSREYAEALKIAEEAMTLVERAFGPDSEKAAIQTYSLGLIAEAAEQYDAAETYYARSVAIRQKLYGPDSAGTAQALEKQGQVMIRAGRFDAAEPVVNRVLKIRSDLVGAAHSFNAGAHANIGELHLRRGRIAPALVSYRQAVKLLTGQSVAEGVARSVAEAEIRASRHAFAGLAEAAWSGRTLPGSSPAALLAETFAASQQAWTTSAASALAKMTARLGAGDTPLGRRIRAEQDTASRILTLQDEDMAALADWSRVQRGDPAYKAAEDAFRQASIAQSRDTAPIIKRQRELIDLLTALQKRCPTVESAGCAKSGDELAGISQELGKLSAEAGKNSGAMMALHKRLQDAEAALPGAAEFQTKREARLSERQALEAKLRAERAEIVAQFPSYAALANPAPLTIPQVQALLAPEEAVVTILSGRDRSFVWAISKDRAEWSAIKAGDKRLTEEVAALRRGLDPMAAEPAPFDVARAHELYRLVLGPVEGVLAAKKHLIIVPTGPLTSLPFQVLVTEPPVSDGADAVKSASWLLKRHALSVLPSVQSLQALRTLASPGKAVEPFLGIGDPVLKGPAAEDAARGARARGASGGVSLASVYRNGKADLRAIGELQPLPETAGEVRTIAKLLGAKPESLLLGPSASEGRVKATPLDGYRVVHFATHGLVAGELSGLAEAALVMTPPPQASEVDDGLLTSSEIAALNLSADWVVLSACNTAAGNEPNADALSGLARAFFYAGARALLVSHWAVQSDAAVSLTTGAFAALAKDPKLGRAEAMRQTMLAVAAQGLPPSAWAPFVVVGEGGAGR